jgi:hypothetical protein
MGVRLNGREMGTNGDGRGASVGPAVPQQLSADMRERHSAAGRVVLGGLWAWAEAGGQPNFLP